MVATTEQGTRLPLKPLPKSEIQATAAGEQLKVRFISEGRGNNRTAYIATLDEPPQKLAQLNQTARRGLEKIERESGRKLFNNPAFTRQVTIAPPQVTTAKVMLDPSSVTVPEIWTKRDPEAWQAVLATIQEREDTVGRAIEGDQIDSTNECSTQTIEPEAVDLNQPQEKESSSHESATRSGGVDSQPATNPTLTNQTQLATSSQKPVIAASSSVDLGRLTEPEAIAPAFDEPSLQEFSRSNSGIEVEATAVNLNDLLQSESIQGDVARNLEASGYILEQPGGDEEFICAYPGREHSELKPDDKRFMFKGEGWVMDNLDGSCEVTDLGQIAVVVEQLKADYLGKAEPEAVVTGREPTAGEPASVPVATEQNIAKPVKREVETVTPTPTPVPPPLEDLGFRTDTTQAVITIEEGKHQLVANLYESTVSDVQGGKSLQSSAISLEKDFHEPGDVVVMIQEGLLMSDIGELTPESKIRLSEIETRMERNLAAEGLMLPVEQIQVTNVPEQAVEQVAALPLETIPKSQVATTNAPLPTVQPTPPPSTPLSPVPVPLTPIQQAMQVKYDQRRDAAIGMLKTIGVEQVTAEQIDVQIAKSIQLTTHPSKVEQEMNVLGRSPVTQALKNSEGVQTAQSYVHKVWEASLPQQSQGSKPVQRKVDAGR